MKYTAIIFTLLISTCIYVQCMGAAPTQTITGHELMQRAKHFARSVKEVLRMSEQGRRKELLVKVGANPNDWQYAQYIETGKNPPQILVDYIAHISSQLDRSLMELDALLQKK